MAGIIKTGSNTETTGRFVGVTAYQFASFDQRREEYVAAVQQDAEEILKKAEVEAEQIRKKAAEQGAHDARVAAEKERDRRVAEALQTALPALQSATKQLADAQTAWQRHAEDELIKLAVAIAEKVVRKELVASPESVVATVKSAIELAGIEAAIRVRVHPRDARILQSQEAALQREMPQFAKLSVDPDESLSPGDCVVQTEFGLVDMSVDSQLSRIVEELSSGIAV